MQFQKGLLEVFIWPWYFSFRYSKLILRFNGRDKIFVKTFKNEKRRHQWQHYANANASAESLILSWFSHYFIIWIKMLANSINTKHDPSKLILQDLSASSRIYLGNHLYIYPLAFHFQCKTLFIITIYIYAIMKKCNSSSQL